MGYAEAMSGTVDSVVQALRLLRLLDQRGALTLTDLARLTGLTNSRCHRLLATLVEEGFVYRRDGEKIYRAVPSTTEPAGGASFPTLLEAAFPVLRALAEQSGETSHLAVLARRSVYFLAGVESTQLLRVTSRVGTHIPVHTSAAGKAVLAYRTDEQVRALLGDDALPIRTDRTLSHVDELLAELHRARRLGYARNLSESETGMAVLAVPVRVGAEPPSLALSLSGPESRVNPRRTTGLSIREREHLALLKDAAGRLARHSR